MSGICDTCKREPCHMRFDGCKTYDVYEGGETRYEKLFGTPERAAEYFAMQCFGSDGSLCYYCPFDDCDENLRNMGTYPSVHDMMLEWLRGDAQ